MVLMHRIHWLLQSEVPTMVVCRQENKVQITHCSNQYYYLPNHIR